MMKRHRWHRVPMVIAMSLAPLFETNLHLTLRLQTLGASTSGRGRWCWCCSR